MRSWGFRCFAIGLYFAIVLDRENQTGGHPWSHFQMLLGSSLISGITGAAIHGGAFAIVRDRVDHTSGHPWPHSSNENENAPLEAARR
jgi:hypothetical protein